MAKKIGPRAVIVDRSGEPVTLLPGDEVPTWAEDQIGDHVLDTETEADETEGGQPLQDKGTRIDGAAPEAGVPDPADTPDPDLTGDSETPDFTQPVSRSKKK